MQTFFDWEGRNCCWNCHMKGRSKIWPAPWEGKLSPGGTVWLPSRSTRRTGLLSRPRPASSNLMHFTRTICSNFQDPMQTTENVWLLLLEEVHDHQSRQNTQHCQSWWHEKGGLKRCPRRIGRILPHPTLHCHSPRQLLMRAFEGPQWNLGRSLQGCQQVGDHPAGQQHIQEGHRSCCQGDWISLWVSLTRGHILTTNNWKLSMPSEPSEDKHPSNPGRKGTASTMEQKWQQGQVQTIQPVWTHAEGMQKVLVLPWSLPKENYICPG
jgi:hypothetical protein